MHKSGQNENSGFDETYFDNGIPLWRVSSVLCFHLLRTNLGTQRNAIQMCAGNMYSVGSLLFSVISRMPLFVRLGCSDAHTMKYKFSYNTTLLADGVKIGTELDGSSSKLEVAVVSDECHLNNSRLTFLTRRH